MSELGDIYSALVEGRAACNALESWQTSADGRDLVRSRLQYIERGITAHERLSSQLRDGRKHVEPPDDYELTSCGCGHPNASPPCSYCTSGADEAEDESGEQPADERKDADLYIDLTEEQAARLRDYIGTEAEQDRPVSLAIADGRAGFGLYAYDTEYPDEAAEFICALAEKGSQT